MLAQRFHSSAAAALEQQLAQDGCAVIAPLLPDEEVRAVIARLRPLPGNDAGTRALLEEDWVRELGERLCADPRLRVLLPHEARVVQCTLFEKSLSRNWLVALHQDLSIPVTERVPSPLCTGWSEKEGVLYVQPPVAVLEGLLAIRVHLDDTDERNGALRVVPGSHRRGRLGPQEVQQARTEHSERVLPVPRGGALLMRPLLLHASSRAVRETPRRVLHFVVGPASLPEALSWRVEPAAPGAGPRAREPRPFQA